MSVADPWLACSPDAIISRSACTEPQHVLLEVKCPQRCQAASLADVASQKGSGFCLELVDGHFHLKLSHKYYYQVQLNLLVTDLQLAMLLVWTPQEMFVQPINRNDDLLSNILPRLHVFYFKHLLPALYTELVNANTTSSPCHLAVLQTPC